MSEQTYTITRALTRVKTLADRLEELGDTGTRNIGNYIGTVLEQRKDSDGSKKYVENANANFNSFNDLFDELVKVKNAIKASNAVATITINGETMTISEAITLKECVHVKRNFYRELLKRYEECEKSVERAEAEIEDKARKQVEKLNLDSKDNYETILDAARTSVVKDSRIVVVGIDNIEKVREEFNKLDNFFEEIDYKLSESNAVTVITL